MGQSPDMLAEASTYSYGLALALAIGSLLFYLSQAFWYRTSPSLGHRTREFNLGLPATTRSEALFANSLVASGTSLATVLVFFLTAAPLFGWWLLMCPFLFAVGNWVLYRVYLSVDANGYFAETPGQTEGVSGLIPFLGYRLTGSRSVGWLLLIVSLVNLLAVLTLELVIGVEVFGYLASRSMEAPASSISEFGIFVFALVLLLAYVFVGGFRAVVASDAWQMRAIKLAIILTLASLILVALTTRRQSLNLSVLHQSPPPSILWGFVVNVILANLFAPLSQESSWQRFRAFRDKPSFMLGKAMRRSIATALALWCGMILLAFVTQIITSDSERSSLSSISGFLETIRVLDDWWFPFFVFPVLAVAALSALFSTADTCIAALLYLIQYSDVSQKTAEQKQRLNQLPVTYYAAMALIFLFSVGIYAFVRLWFKPTIFQLVFSVFSNLIVIAPAVLTTAICRPASSSDATRRTTCIVLSVIVGLLVFWTSAVIAIIGGADYLWLSQLSIAFGLIGAGIPVLPLWFSSPNQRLGDVRN